MAQIWHSLSEDGALTVARRLPARFDVAAHVDLPRLRPGRLAHHVRRDLWRELREIRGFSPVIRVEPHGQGLRLTAGGRVEGAPVPPTARARIEAFLSDPARRARWIANAGCGR